jgi:hypothetical protein
VSRSYATRLKQDAWQQAIFNTQVMGRYPAMIESLSRLFSHPHYDIGIRTLLALIVLFFRVSHVIAVKWAPVPDYLRYSDRVCQACCIRDELLCVQTYGIYQLRVILGEIGSKLPGADNALLNGPYGDAS